jgi:hypothetical protein
VRLPKEFRFEGEELSIRREGEAVILEPLSPRALAKGLLATMGQGLQGPRPGLMPSSIRLTCFLSIA